MVPLHQLWTCIPMQKWTLLVNHDTSGGYFTYGDYVRDSGNPTSSTYMILDQVDNYKLEMPPKNKSLPKLKCCILDLVMEGIIIE